MYRTTLATILILASTSVFADAAHVKTGQELLKRYPNALVEISAVAKMKASMGGGNQEQQVKATGTVLSSDGLVMFAYHVIDRTKMFAKGIPMNMGGQRQMIQITFELSEVQIRLTDGTEIPARIVLKDPDLGVGFLIPEKKLDESIKFSPVDITEMAEAPKQFDRYVGLTRLGKNLNYKNTARFGRVAAIVKKPRTRYVAESTPGTPVFDLKGKLLGLSVLHVDDSGANVAAMMRGGLGGGTLITLPAEDLKDLVDQVKEALGKNSV